MANFRFKKTYKEFDIREFDIRKPQIHTWHVKLAKKKMI